MTKRPTDQWEALLDGTPPAPWKAYALERHPNSDTYIVGADGRRVAGSDRSDAAVPHESTDLVTAAPEAVAELVRLRRALEQQLAYIAEELEAEGVETHDDIEGTWPSMQRYGELSEMIDQRDFLTRILEGNQQ